MSQEPLPLVRPPESVKERPAVRAGHVSDDHTCVIYSLEDLGTDPDLGKWVAETIPVMIAPGTWEGKGVLRYYAPKNILAVYHNAAVHTKVSAFLQDLKKSAPRGSDRKFAVGRAAVGEEAVHQAGFRVPLAPAPQPVPAPTLSYPVPPQTHSPKHLFHFIIRYEGEGIVDDNVVKAIKAQYQIDKKEKEGKEEKEDKDPGPTPPVRAATAPDSPVLPGVVPYSPSIAPAPSANKKTDKQDKEEKKS
jgi:hypothetical protein